MHHFYPDGVSVLSRTLTCTPLVLCRTLSFEGLERLGHAALQWTDKLSLTKAPLKPVPALCMTWEGPRDGWARVGE